MKKIIFCRKLIVLFFSLLIITACTSKTQRNGEHVRERDKDWGKYKIRENLTTQKLVEEMGVGINLGNTLEACGDWINGSEINDYVRAWGSPVPTEAMIAGYASAGFSSLRIPVAWSNLMNLDGYIINPELFALVENVVNWTIDNGMVALVNLHWDNGWWHDFPTDYDECMKRYRAIWTQICERFKGYGDWLVFENMNEVGFDDIWTPWRGSYNDKQRAFNLVNDLNQVFVDIVRASGGNNGKRHLLINVYNTGLEYAYDSFFKVPNDPANRMAASVHYYTPAVFAILSEDADWGKARDTWGTPVDLNELNTNMNLLKTNCVNKGIPVIIGEFAACGDNKTEEMKRLYAVSVAKAVYSRGMCPMLWDTPGGQYDRDLFKFSDPLLIEQLKAIPAKYPR
jgi:endoglucanase